jgi:membrane protease subunit HflK
VELGFRLAVDDSGPLQADALERLQRDWAPLSGSGGPVAEQMRAESWMLTGNEDILDVKWAVQYRIRATPSGEGLLQYLYGVADPEQLVRSAAEAAIRAAVGSRDIDTLLTTERGAVQRAIREELLRAALDQCASGVEVVEVCLIDVHAPPEVHEAFRDVHSAAEEKMQIVNLAREYFERVVREAAGEAAERVIRAQGQAVGITCRACGEADAFLAQLDAYRNNEFTTRLRLYFEAVDAVLGKLRKFIHAAGGSPADFDLWLIKDGARSALPFAPRGDRADTVQVGGG